MEVKITLEILAYLIAGLMLWTTFLWGFSHVILTRKFNIIFEMFDILASGVVAQHQELAGNQRELHKNLSDQHTILENSIKKEKEVFDENDYH